MEKGALIFRKAYSANLAKYYPRAKAEENNFHFSTEKKKIATSQVILQKTLSEYPNYIF